jgi:hypothetical protein
MSLWYFGRHEGFKSLLIWFEVSEEMGSSARMRKVRASPGTGLFRGKQK